MGVSASSRRRSSTTTKEAVELVGDNLDFNNVYRSSTDSSEIFSAILNNYPVSQLIELINEKPSLCELKNKEGKYPLQIAFRKALDMPDGSLSDLLEALINAFPQACLSNHDMTLHMLLRKNYPPSLILSVIANDANICRYADEGGHLPLQIVIERGHQSDLIIAVLNAYPAAAIHYETFYPQRRIPPLQAALRKSCRLEVISAFVTKCPQSCSMKDTSGNLPLHVALNKHCSDDIILRLISGCPSACSIADSNGRMPLLQAVTEKFSHSVIQRILQANPAGAKCRDLYGHFPLHIAAKQHPSSEVVLLLINAYRDACSIPVHKSNNFLPLHFALTKYRRPTKIIAELVYAYPDACKVKVGTFLNPDLIRVLPLHMAVNYADEDAVMIVMTAYPDACQVQDQDGKTPLHLIFQRDHDTVSYNETTKLALKILQTYTLASTMKDNSLALPIHMALKHRGAYEAIYALIRANPVSLRHRDSDGMLPIHVAAKQGKSIDIVRLLIDNYPEGCLERDQRGYTPMHYAAVTKNFVLVNYLISRNARACRQGDAEARLPVHSLLNEIDSTLASASTKRHSYRPTRNEVSCLQLLLKAFPPVANIKLSDEGTAITFAFKKSLGKDILRLLLNAKPDTLKPNDISIYKNLNWNERKAVVRVCHELVHERVKRSNGGGIIGGLILKLCSTLQEPRNLSSGQLHRVILFL